MKTQLILTAILGAIGVAFGAMGAHVLSSKISEHQIEIWNTGVKYQMIHVLLLFILLLNASAKQYQLPVNFIFFGILFFSGSLYLLALKDLLSLQSFTKFIGPITPIGGLCFIIGWVLLAIQFSKQ